MHCFIPKRLLRGDISPIVKDKKGNKSDSNNFRPIMQSSCLLKILEMHILSILDDKIMFTPNQFGFVKNLSTTEACFLLKETVGNYISKNNRVYANFIELSKTFYLKN